MGLLAEHRRTIGDLRVSPLGLGTVKFGRNTDVKYPRPFELPGMSELASLLDIARELGINLIDTAPAYGDSEVRLGRLLAEDRHQWIITTKVGETYEGASVYDFSREGTIRSIESSLRRLRTDYLDIVLAHCHDEDESVLQSSPVMETLKDMKKRGLIRYVGASTKTVPGGLLAIEGMDLAMVSYNLADQSQLPVITRAGELGKAVLLKKVLASGFAKDVSANLKAALDVPAVASVVLGTISEAHLRANVEDTVAALAAT